jgi:hypothetical protein
MQAERSAMHPASKGRRWYVRPDRAEATGPPRDGAGAWPAEWRGLGSRFLTGREGITGAALRMIRYEALPGRVILCCEDGPRRLHRGSGGAVEGRSVVTDG